MSGVRARWSRPTIAVLVFAVLAGLPSQSNAANKAGDVSPATPTAKSTAARGQSLEIQPHATISWSELEVMDAARSASPMNAAPAPQMPDPEIRDVGSMGMGRIEPFHQPADIVRTPGVTAMTRKARPPIQIIAERRCSQCTKMDMT